MEPKPPARRAHPADQPGLRRDQVADERDAVAAQRDEQADQRDARAEDRDAAAEQRDLAADERDQAGAERDASRERRDLAAEQVEESGPALTAAQARQRLTSTRRQAAGDRRHASQDRAAGAGERGCSEVDRDLAMVERGEAAADRRRAERDRTVSRADRGGAATDRRAASLDSLTGAYLRSPGFLELERDLARAQRQSQPLVLAFVDVDHLKQVNDAQGHAAGDRLLIDVVATLAAKLRPHDVIIRYGGDEFVCVMLGLSLADATARLELVNEALALSEERGSVSFGFAELQESDSSRSLLGRADASLYRSRNATRQVLDP